MQYVLGNPITAGYGICERRPDAICPFCGTEIYSTVMATVSEQLSASGRYCEECIEKLDTPATRYQWLIDHALQDEFLAWYFADETNQGQNEAFKTVANWYVKKWHKKHPGEFNDYLNEYISNKHGHTYMQWLFQTN